MEKQIKKNQVELQKAIEKIKDKTEELNQVQKDLKKSNKMRKVNINELEDLFKLILDKLRIDGVNDINIDFNDYWLILTDEWNNFKEALSQQ